MAIGRWTSDPTTRLALFIQIHRRKEYRPYASLFDAWGYRIFSPEETYGFAANILFLTNATTGTYALQSIQTYTDPLRSGGYQYIHGWTNPATGLNAMSNVAPPDAAVERPIGADASLPALRRAHGG